MNTHFFYRFFLIICFLWAVGYFASAQTVKQLEKERQTMLQQLETTNKVLNETQRSQKASVNKLNVLKRNINARQGLISAINKEIASLDAEIEKLTNEKTILEEQLTRYRNDYANLVQEAHLSRSNYSKLMFILSAENFDQSFRRFRYLQEYSDYRKEQAHEIEKTVVEIALKNDSLLLHKSSKMKNLRDKESETKKLSNDQEKEKKLYSDLQKKEKDLRAKQKEQQKQADALNSKIEKLIAEEIRKAEEKKKKDAKSDTKDTQTTQPSSVLTKEQQLIAGGFEKNKGRLPWPTEKGFITGRYGVQPHAVLKYVTTNNKGIYIQTPVGTTARAVFEGVVTQRFSIPGSNNAVIVQHGNYRTVYANLTDIYVKEGQKVKEKEVLGKIFSDTEDDDKTELYFQVWKDKEIQNPEIWLAK
jgi:Membrane-bound metallopeptidase